MHSGKLGADGNPIGIVTKKAYYSYKLKKSALNTQVLCSYVYYNAGNY